MIATITPMEIPSIAGRTVFVGDTASQLFDYWFDPIESAVRERARAFVEELIRGEIW